MEHTYFLILNFAAFFLVVFLDSKKWKDYLILGIFTLVLAFIFENATAYLGFWYYNSEPMLLLISLYTWLLYVPYISFCYFVSNRLVKHV